jgi:deazaflavin-dependent oxidoreductase (nitroreductase family)
MRGMPFTERLRNLSWLGSTAFAVIGKRIFPRTDLAVQRATHGRLSLTGTVGMPLLLLTTTGRRSGRPRVTPLIYAEDGDGFLVVGSNWGQRDHPAWALNLRATPEAELEIHGRRANVTACLLEDPERADAWKRLVRIWPQFDTYAARATERELLVFRLTER